MAGSGPGRRFDLLRASVAPIVMVELVVRAGVGTISTFAPISKPISPLWASRDSKS
jgi:hypothetical protein